MKIYYVICVAVLAGLAVVTIVLRGQSDSFYGIADAQEVVINFETAVEIREIRIVAGQTVAAGDTLLRLYSDELDLKISQTGHELDELKSRKAAHATMSQSELRQLKSQQEERANALKDKIQQLESHYETNRKLVAEMRSIKPDELTAGTKSDASNPLMVELDNLKRELARIQDSSQIVFDRLHNELSYTGNPLQDQVRRLADELKLMLAQRERLVVTARAGGIIGVVNFKAGEKVSPFTAIATLHAAAPSYVLGYIPENMYSQVRVGHKVVVSSQAARSSRVDGEVVGVGTRIVEYPVRLRKHPDVQMWGREIIIKIPDDNTFLLGEKVLINVVQRTARLGVRGALSPRAVHAAASERDNWQVAEITCTAGVPVQPALEASGVLYLDDLRQYLVISDETSGPQPLVYLMDTSGTVRSATGVDHLRDMTDMESVTQDEQGRIYIAASQSWNKKGKLSDARKRLVRIKRDGAQFALDGSVALLDLLAAAAAQDPRTDWAVYLSGAIRERTIDLEAMACRHGALYLGFKNPPDSGKSVILRIDDMAAMFTTGAIRPSRISLWSRLDLRAAASDRAKEISDMQFIGDTLYIMARTALAQDNGPRQDVADLWAFREGATPQRVQHFTGLRPEGIAFNTASGTWLVICDNGAERPSQIMVGRVGL
jgi:multidrug resistance efflux pump